MSKLNPLSMGVGAARLNMFVVLTGVLGLLWFAAGPVRYVLCEPGQTTCTDFEPVFIGLTCAHIACLGHLLGLTLGAGARVLGRRQTPSGLWRLWLRASLHKTSLLWAMVTVGAVTLLMPEYAPWHGLTGAALASLFMSLSVLRTLATQGVVPLFWAWFGPFVLLYALVGSSGGGRGLMHAMHGFDTMPWEILLCEAASWPLLALWLTRRWHGQVPRVRAQSSAASFNLWKDTKGLALRYTPLTGAADYANPAPNPSKRPVLQGMFWPAYLVLIQIGLARPLGTGVAAWEVWLLGLLAIVASTFLVCKDLHWRMLLAPAGMRRGALGWHIAFSTVTVSFMGLLIGVGVVVAVVWVYLPISFEKLTAYLARFSMVPLQLVFAISVGTLIRGTRYPRRWQWGLVTVWALAGIAVLVLSRVFGVDSLQAEWFAVDYPYVLGLLMLSALALWFANRLWTVDKLLQCAPK